jgi:hypothetical protein
MAHAPARIGLLHGEFEAIDGFLLVLLGAKNMRRKNDCLSMDAQKLRQGSQI